VESLESRSSAITSSSSPRLFKRKGDEIDEEVMIADVDSRDDPAVYN
jgi:hypothetical protein